MKHNFHTHTYRCMHADGTDEAYVRAAIESGFTRIGFSDHSPWPYKDFVSGMRMSVSEFPGYVQSVRALQEKYRGKIEILLGLECEYFPQYLPWMREQVQTYGLDYLILGHHFSPTEPGGIYNGNLTTPELLKPYREAVLAGMESGMFAYLAHPDLFMRGYPAFDAHCEKLSREIVEKAMQTGTPLEYNILGMFHGKRDGKPGYPHPAFWRIAGEYGAVAIIGIDAHTPDAFRNTALFNESEAFLRSLGLQIIDDIALQK
ncbi:MAG: histidinol-phosphatase [Clostridia bacterium]|nr:histidinol-phosphatase [Clostridia bacterium]